ncbi:hypothetical protein CANTEDRAFT_107542 [Yamadazyma tenuis ATCC 10573]|nr:uncharacterized protein CANTEDRAFT_107542 [Yamadazyma tenuis ATCC 10573]EGV61354.1 hypothetical protein CANTEDRAFT_107542 [Yamadazyma tenuis ATCC 10573]
MLLSPITSIESYNQTISKALIPDESDARRLTSINDLPLEILMKIIGYVYFDSDNFDSIYKLLESFTKLGLVSKLFHLLSVKYLYKYAAFNRPHAFHKFLINLQNNPNLGKYVQFVDFETFTSIGLGRTGKMNQEIQMVTSRTIFTSLTKTPNLIEFLASENIQDDMNVDVLNYLFNELPNLQSLDFCGASSKAFYEAFRGLTIDKPLKKLFKVSFHDCSNLSVDIFEKILPHLVNLRRLDLTHTSVNSSLLLNYLPNSCNLTHLSLSRCSKLTTRDLINFLVNHPSVANNQLQWLNLSVDSNVVTPLNSNYLFFTLKHMNASNLQYLNLKGLPITEKLLTLINMKFQNLKTLSIAFSSIDFEFLFEFLLSTPCLAHIDLTGCKLTKAQILQLITIPHLSSLECESQTLKDLTNNESQFIRRDSLVWRFHDNNGRRAWIYRLESTDDQYKQIQQFGKILNLNLTYYDLNTGEKIVTKNLRPRFLKYVGKKINCSVGFQNLQCCKHKKYLNNSYDEDVWPGKFCETGIYNYYSLNI